MSWIWGLLANIGRMGRDAWNDAKEQARQAELRRMRDQGKKSIAPEEYTQGWNKDDSPPEGRDTWGQETTWGSSDGGFWWQNSGDQGGIFGPSDSNSGDQGEGDFGTGGFGSGIEGGGFDGGGSDGGGGD